MMFRLWPKRPQPQRAHPRFLNACPGTGRMPRMVEEWISPDGIVALGRPKHALVLFAPVVNGKREKLGLAVEEKTPEEAGWTCRGLKPYCPVCDSRAVATRKHADKARGWPTGSLRLHTWTPPPKRSWWRVFGHGEAK